jgi:hypothetical protein
MNSAQKSWLSRGCWQFLVLTALTLCIFPSTSIWLGQTWLWLITLPASTLLIVHRDCWAAMRASALVRRPRRRLGHLYPVEQARRVGFGHRLPKQLPSRAA